MVGLADAHAAAGTGLVHTAAGRPAGRPRGAGAPGAEPPHQAGRIQQHQKRPAQILAQAHLEQSHTMTRIATRPCPFRESEMLRQGGIHPVLARLYASRGLTDTKDLSSELAAMIPPAGLLHIDAAAVFLADAIAAGKRMVIVADYDCDGATACAVALRGLRAMGEVIDFIVPNRFEYGYGLTPEIVELTAREKQPDIIITVDNGIASIDGVAEANRRGIEVVVTDHHLPSDTLPDARVIVNPNQPQCGFPSKHLAGVGVVFYVLLALRGSCASAACSTHRRSPSSITCSTWSPSAPWPTWCASIRTTASSSRRD